MAEEFIKRMKEAGLYDEEKDELILYKSKWCEMRLPMTAFKEHYAPVLDANDLEKLRQMLGRDAYEFLKKHGVIVE